MARLLKGVFLAMLLSLELGASSVKLMRESRSEFESRPEVTQLIEIEPDWDLLAAAIFHESNRRRVEHHLPAFLPLAKANHAADSQASMIALRMRPDHSNLFSNHATLSLRLRAAGLGGTRAAENVAATPLLPRQRGQTVYRRVGEDGRPIFSLEPDGPPIDAHTYASFAVQVTNQWMNSPGHRANLLDRDLRHLGIACSFARLPSGSHMIYSVQVFFTPK